MSTSLPMSRIAGPWGTTTDIFLDPEPARLRGLLWRRPLAYMVDVAILALLSSLVFVVAAPTWPIAFTLIPLAYHSLLIGGPHAATFGQRLFAIEVRRLDGGRPTLLQAFVQTVMFYATVALTTCLILLVPLFNRRRRTLHDVLAGTLTLRRSSAPEILLPGSGARP